jgi:hypothetical protein
MHSHEPILAQYHIFAERRLHFGKLFWINIAFFLALLLLAAAIFKDLGPPALGWFLLIAGLATLQISYITHRIRTVEDTYERLMNTIEERLRAAGHADCPDRASLEEIRRAFPGDRCPRGRRCRPRNRRLGHDCCGMMRVGLA